MEGDEICDGNCPTTCADDGDPCTMDVLRGGPCMVECKHETIDMGVQNACGGCDTLRNETGFNMGDYCQVGVGACFATGTIACRTRPGNELHCTARGAIAKPEECNGEDDDCDGLVDDDADAQNYCIRMHGPEWRCAVGYGECRKEETP